MIRHRTPNREVTGFNYRLFPYHVTPVEFYLYPTVGTVLIHSVKPELTE